MIKEFSHKYIKVNDDYCKNAFSMEIKYLKSLESDRLLAGFRKVAGLPKKADVYEGWENTEIKGHTMGHYLTALCQGYLSLGEDWIRERIRYICSELRACQSNTGYLFAGDEEIFDRVEQKQPAWVPWYTMHKIMEGLLSAWNLTRNEDAKETLVRLGSWIANRTSKWDDEMKRTVWQVEYGGMNDCLYDLYQAFGEEEYLRAAHCFDEIPLLEELYHGNDVLNGRHANTTIPKILGALNRYVVLGEEDSKINSPLFYLEVAKNFFDIVTKHHTYITGGNSEWEHFGEPDILDKERTSCNCETCNTYNMLKLSKRLYMITGEIKYMDFFEHTWINAILSSGNPETGMTMYFQPMATGYFKVYGTPFDKFWCCIGTGMENFTKLQDGIYFYDKEDIFVNAYRSSSINAMELGVSIKLESKIPYEKVTVKINTKESFDGNVHFRVPFWSVGGVNVQVENASYVIDENVGYVIISNIKTESLVILTFYPRLQVHRLPDSNHCVAFTYGPVVLSSALGKEDMVTTSTGVDVTIPTRESFFKDYIEVNEEVSLWLKDASSHFIQEGKTSFREKESNLLFTPHFMQHEQKYGIYWNIYKNGDAKLLHYINRVKKRMEMEASIIDSIPIGNDQYELAHKVKGEKTKAIMSGEEPYRKIEQGGYLSYELTLRGEKTSLTITFSKEKSEANILFEDIKINELDRIEKGDYIIVSYDMPQVEKGMLCIKSKEETVQVYGEIIVCK